MASEKRLKQLRDELYALHEAMLEAEEQALDTDPAQPSAVKESVKESLEAHYHDPASGWLRELLALVTQYDAALAADRVSSEDAEDLMEQTRALILPEEAGLPAEGTLWRSIARAAGGYRSQRDPGTPARSGLSGALRISRSPDGIPARSSHRSFRQCSHRSPHGAGSARPVPAGVPACVRDAADRS